MKENLSIKQRLISWIWLFTQTDIQAMNAKEKRRYVDRLVGFAIVRYGRPGRSLLRGFLEKNIDSHLSEIQSMLRPILEWIEGREQPPLKNPLLEWIGEETPFTSRKAKVTGKLDKRVEKALKVWFKKDRIPSLQGRYSFKRKYALHTINGRFTVSSEIGLVEDPDWWKDIIFENFIQLISGLPADLFSKRMIKCKGCGRVFLHLTMRKKDFCSPECASRSIARAKREALKENPRKYAAYKKAMKEYKENWKREKNKKRKKQTRAKPTK